MRIEDCFEIGYLSKAHGTKGEHYLQLDVDDPSEYLEMESVFILTKDGLVPFFLEYTKTTTLESKLVVKFEEVNSKKEADQLKASKVFLTLDDLPELGDEHFYYHEIIGYSVHDNSFGKVGEVENVYEMPSDDILSVTYEGVEVLIPLSKQVYQSIDKANKVIHVNCPDGLIDLYISNQKEKPDDEN